MNLVNDAGFSITLRHTFNYFSSRIIRRAIGFISIPILTRLLIPNDYGILSVYSTSVALFLILMTLNCSSAIDRYYYEEKDDFKDFFGTTIILVFILFLIFFSLLLFCQKTVSNLLGLPDKVFIYIILSVPFSVSATIFNELYTARRESKRIAIVDVSSGWIGLAVAIAFVIILDKNRYLGVIWASLVVGFFYTLYHVYRLKPFFKWAFNLNHLKYIFTYCIPLIPYSLSGYILNYFDLLMLNSYRGSTAAGLYALAYKIGMLLQILVNSLFGALTPLAFKYLNKKAYYQFTSDIDKALKLIFFATVFLIYFGADLGIILADQRYHESLKIVPIIVMGYLFLAMWEPYKIGILYSKKTIHFALVNIFSATVNVVLNAIFIPKYGYVAAAFTTLVSFMIMPYAAFFINKLILKDHTFSFFLIHKKCLIILPFIAIYYLLPIFNLPYLGIVAIKLTLMSILFVLLLGKYYKEIINRFGISKVFPN